MFKMDTKFIVFMFMALLRCTALEVDENYKLPDMYEMDDYNDCRINNGLYCKFIFKIFPENNDNKVWKIIQKKKENPYNFHRDIVYRYRCVPRNLQSKVNEISRIFSKQETERLKNVSLTVKMTDMQCRKFDKNSFSKKDTTFLYFIISYLLLVTSATLFHDQLQNSTEKHIFKVSKYVLCFSIKTHWNKFLEPVKNSDYQRLKCFQGFKGICMFGVIMGHTMMSLVPMSTKNPEIYENIYANPIFKFFIHFGMHFVQIYFLMSAWLFMNGFFSLCLSGKLVGRPGVFIQSFVVRYGRLIGPLALFVFFSRTTLYEIFERGPQAGHIHINHDSCNNNGWATLFLINNHLHSKDQCYFITWYISADFQLFLASLVLSYAIVQYRLKEKHCLGIVSVILGLSWVYNAAVIYINHLPVSVGTSPEKSKLENSLSSHETYVMYTSLYSNIGGYCVGLIGGAVYNELKDNGISNTKWLLKCGLLSPFMIFLSVFNYSRIMNAIIGASMKPLFNTGIACLILGMVLSKQNGILKRIFEWKYLEYLAKLNYSIYLSHYWTTFGQELLFQGIIEVSYLKIFLIYIADSVVAILIGFVVFILFESPVRSLLSVILNRNSKKMPKDI